MTTSLRNPDSGPSTYFHHSTRHFACNISSIFTIVLQRLYKHGARKMVLVGSGPLGCIPNYLSQSSNNSCVEEINNLIMLFNSRLIDLTSTLKYTLPGSLFVYQNIYNRFSHMINHPSNYGKQHRIPKSHSVPTHTEETS